MIDVPQVVALVGMVVAVVAVVAAVLDTRHGGPRRRARWAYALAVAAAVGGCVPAGYAVLDSDEPPADPGVRIVDPPLSGAEPVSWCPTVRISGDLPRGRTLAVAVHEENDPRFYYEGSVQRNEEAGTWTASVRLGEDPESSVGATFDILVVGLDADLARYLVNTNEDANDTWWSAPDGAHLPPGAEVLDQVAVLRSSDVTNCG